ncbi:hypothetical protein F5884DRAFT_398396 [Xylogone sp. PMI_703]|nr:hypothetical protein F5884DRAFT_398396 [Xylogone sp. PMI_703]
MRDIKTEIINTTMQIGDLVDWLILRHSQPEPYEPTMYIDLEGVNLCREGSLSILTLLIDTGGPTRRVCLIDVYSLGLRAFNTTGVKGKTLKDILQDEKIPKVFFDVISYCVGDVQYLPELWSKFRWKTNRWRDLVNEETKKRVEASQKPEYQPHGPDRTLTPWSSSRPFMPTDSVISRTDLEASFFLC